MSKSEWKLRGRWRFEEDFHYGLAKGILILHQKKNHVHGTLTLTEFPLDGPPFKIEETVEGKIDGDMLKLRGTAYKVLQADGELIYELDAWNGHITDKKLIVGSGKGGKRINTVFTLRKVPD
ncbi:hypothetical protein FUAX_32160 [Fulvitalea axinellae]|uniref:Lipocalin-like domain-containing protein n=1 Tax=Fulvitalea axinellae TaxID=1182444 RepID=A0AAU9CF27_9BACT|nr:hypothetical protein FUAX_32160 [Fulvitalea axinellae]